MIGLSAIGSAASRSYPLRIFSSVAACHSFDIVVGAGPDITRRSNRIELAKCI